MRALRGLDILDTVSEERFDRITRLARRLFDVPIALVSLVDSDRQWFKSRAGLDAPETPRDVSFCGHAILGSEPFVINDALEDDRFCDNPLVLGAPKVRFYAGRPLHGPNGHRLGTLCLIDHEPRTLDQADLRTLEDLAGMVEDELASLTAATTDPLTGLSNRSGFHRLAEHTLRLALRRKERCRLLYIDMDEFKPINDVHGHAAGDEALREMAGQLTRCLRVSDVVARLGGDEFVALLAGGDAGPAEDRLAASVALRNRTTDKPYALRYTVGVATFEPENPRPLRDLVNDADHAMRQLKETNSSR